MELHHDERTQTKVEIKETLSHGELMAELGMALGAREARSAVLDALYTAKYRPLTETEIRETIARLDAIADKHEAKYEIARGRRVAE